MHKNFPVVKFEVRSISSFSDVKGQHGMVVVLKSYFPIYKFNMCVKVVSNMAKNTFRTCNKSDKHAGVGFFSRFLADFRYLDHQQRFLKTCKFVEKI